MSNAENKRQKVVDPVRRKAVAVGPEEIVRQKVIALLTQRLGVPPGLIAVEKVIGGSNSRFRADIVAYTKDGKPWMIVECKAPDVVVSQDAFDQIGVYNNLTGARYLFVTNGEDHYCCEWNVETGSMTYLDEIPVYPGNKWRSK